MKIQSIAGIDFPKCSQITGTGATSSCSLSFGSAIANVVSHAVVELTCSGIRVNSPERPNSDESGYMFLLAAKMKRT